MTERVSRPWRQGLGLIAMALAIVTGANTAGGAGTPGKFDYYVVALSWSPSFCAGEGRRGKSPQCAGSRPYAFVLHGLWPQYETGWPDHCGTGSKPQVARQLINSMLDIMPARSLVIHQYNKHGTCSGLGPERYFEAARMAFNAIRIPPRYLNPRKPLLISPREIENDFLTTNQRLKPDMIAISCGRDRRLREVRICFTKDLQPRACGANEAQPKLCPHEKLVMPPVRGR